MRGLDFSSWQTVLASLAGLALITVIGVGIRLLVMVTIQQRRERENRQINERLKTLMAAYKTLGGSFTGDLAVDPTHLRELRHREPEESGSDRTRRVRDAVEAALSDIILLGTDEQVRLATQAAQEMVSGKQIHTAELVTSLRNFIRSALGLDPIPASVEIPRQGPSRSAGSGGGRDRQSGGESRGGRGAGGGMGMGAGLGMGMGGLGVGAGVAASDVDQDQPQS